MESVLPAELSRFVFNTFGIQLRCAGGLLYIVDGILEHVTYQIGLLIQMRRRRCYANAKICGRS